MTYSIRLPDEVEKRLQILSEQTGRSKAFYVKKAILEHLGDIEDIRAGRTRTIALQEIMKKYGMDKTALMG